MLASVRAAYPVSNAEAEDSDQSFLRGRAAKAISAACRIAAAGGRRPAHVAKLISRLEVHGRVHLIKATTRRLADVRLGELYDVESNAHCL